MAAAHDLCTGLRPYRKRRHMQAGVGRYGVFSGKSWENRIFPILKNVILSSDRGKSGRGRPGRGLAVTAAPPRCCRHRPW
jgi:poly-beta-hydroxyalkanoate depolymerase